VALSTLVSSSTAQVSVAITERSEVGAARRRAVEISESIGFDSTQAGKVGLCVTEAATNIVKHAGSGRIVLRVMEQNGVKGVEILALDRGPGMANLGTSLRDGVSTAGSQGTGLGTLARQSDTFEAYAPLGRGTALRLEIWSQPVPPAEQPLGVVCLAMQGEPVSGDAWGVEMVRGNRTCLVADGLGHGPDAAKAALAAVRVLANRPDDEPSQVIEACHRALAPTRGAAIAVARVRLSEQRGSFAGVGNVACRVEQGELRRQLVSHNGTVGHNLRRLQQFEFDFPVGALLIFHSDGLATHWNLGEYPGLAAKHPGLIAGVLYRDHERGRDDVTVVAIRNGTG
jgi:anti-sigma regulatory factor (Ser/Thr protein kinase)